MKARSMVASTGSLKAGSRGVCPKAAWRNGIASFEPAAQARTTLLALRTHRLIRARSASKGPPSLRRGLVTSFQQHRRSVTVQRHAVIIHLQREQRQRREHEAATLLGIAIAQRRPTSLLVRVAGIHSLVLELD